MTYFLEFPFPTIIVVGIIVLFVTILVFTFIIYSMKNVISDINCCGEGQTCSDTYYTPEDNLCHLSLCENSFLVFNKSECVYVGKNVSINLTGEMG